MSLLDLKSVEISPVSRFHCIQSTSQGETDKGPRSAFMATATLATSQHIPSPSLANTPWSEDLDSRVDEYTGSQPPNTPGSATQIGDSTQHSLPLTLPSGSGIRLREIALLEEQERIVDLEITRHSRLQQLHDEKETVQKRLRNSGASKRVAPASDVSIV
jgi:hypothetical protein